MRWAGGGIGWMVRKYGLTIDHLLAVELVTADGELVRASADYANGVYVNFLADEGGQRIHEAYPPATYMRLVALKSRYDPTNLFHLNQNIKPTLSGLFPRNLPMAFFIQ
jgi:FAD/FMN-containing dehydrogenase